MLLVGPVVPVLPVTGVMITGNDAGKALRLQAYYEATDSGRTLFAVTAVMGDALMDGLSDAGSIPARSI